MPAKTAAERQRERRTRLRDNNNDQSELEAYKKKDRERKRKRASMTSDELDRIRRRGKIATRKWRVNKMDIRLVSQPEMNTSPSGVTPFLTPASFGKARRRVEKVLPKSPRKRAAVVQKLATDILKIKLPTVSTNNHGNRELEQTIINYYESDEISRVMPGKADVMTVWHKNGTKLKMQKRHLYMTVGETFQLFKADNPDYAVGVSKFASLRPKHVLLTSKLPQNVCGCKYHNNAILLLDSLHRKYPDVVPVYSSDFIEKCVCNASNEDCMSGNCEMCSDGKLFSQQICAKINELSGSNTPLNWYQWEEDSNKFLSKVQHEGTVQQSLDTLSSQLPRFTWHVFIKREQAKSYDKHKDMAKLLDSDSCVVQMDFAENYTVTFQDEIQSAHWRQRQVTVYTVMIYHRNTTVSRIIVSDCRDHDKRSVAAYTSSVMETIKEDFPTVKNVQIWTDGPSSQYKNKFIFILTSKLANIYQVKLSWNYFATSHGKGPNDALGGNAKRIAHQRVLSRQIVIKDALSFAKAVNLAKSNIDVRVLSQEDIDNKCTELHADELWTHLSTIPGTINTHCVTAINGDSKIQIKFYTSCTRLSTVDFPHQSGTILTGFQQCTFY